MSYYKLNKFAQSKIHLNKGEYNQAFQLLNRVKKAFGFTEYEELIYYILKSKILIKLYRYQEALAEAKIAYKQAKTLNRPLESVDSLVIMAESQRKLRMLDKIPKLLEESEKLIKKLPDVNLNIVKKRIASVNLVKGKYFNGIGNFDEAFKSLKSSLNLWTGLKNQGEIFECLLYIGTLFFRKGDLDLALVYIKQSLEQAEKSKFKQYIMKFHNIISAIYGLKGELETAITHIEKALILAKELNDEFYYAGTLTNLALNYHKLGDVDKAFENLEKSLILEEKVGDKLDIAITLDSIILVALDKGEVRSAEMYLHRLKQIKSESEDFNLEILYKINKALILKSSKDNGKKEKAKEILIKIIEDKKGYAELRSKAIINLCDLLVLEIKETNDTEKIKELEKFINNLTEMANQQNSYLLLTESYLMKSKIALISMDMKKARKLLTHAQELADKYGLNNIAMKISNEHDNLLLQINKWEELKEKEVSINEKLNLANIDEQMNTLIYERVAEPIEIPHEIPVLILILEEGGLVIFSEAFDKDWSFDTDLFGGFLKAMNSFSDELFSEDFDRAKFGQYNLLMKRISTMVIGYLFKGKSYHAQRKLGFFIEQIQEIEPVWNDLINFDKRHQVVTSKEYPDLKNLLVKTFINEFN
ncbi:MAG: tetratricopeptide repeat protein [Candidatus Hodarchaeota archaeon]